MVDESIVMAAEYHEKALVKNGSAFDCGVLGATKCRRLVVPHDAAVETHDQEGQVLVFLEKVLSFGGHPPGRMSIAGVRGYMGTAFKAEADRWTLATYGEWDSHIEGGASIRLLVVVPSGVEVETAEHLSGERSVAHATGINVGSVLLRTFGIMKPWYGPTAPRAGWRAVPTKPDTSRRAARALYPEEDARRMLCGLSIERLQPVADALWKFKDALEQWPGADRAHLLACLDAALQQARSIEIDRRWWKDVGAAGERLRSQFDSAEARKWFSRAIALFPDDLRLPPGWRKPPVQ